MIKRVLSADLRRFFCKHVLLASDGGLLFVSRRLYDDSGSYAGSQGMALKQGVVAALICANLRDLRITFLLLSTEFSV